jgi:adenylate kinase
MIQHVIIFGGPGSGKGTQSAKIIDLGYVHIAPGDILRMRSQEDTDEGRLIQEKLSTGEYFPDDEINEIVAGYISQQLAHDATTRFLYDGYPRTIAQANFLNITLAKYDQKIDLVIYLEVSDAILRQRILKRGETSNRPDDNNPESIEVRITSFHQKTRPILQQYLDAIVFIDGEESIDKISTNIVDALCIHKNIA